MKKLKLFTTVSLLAIALVFAPFTSFARENERAENKKIKVEQRAKQNNSIWSRFFGGLFDSKVSIASSVSLTPNISSITAPTVLKTGEMGTWTVKASDPQNGSLSYAVDWGEDSKSTARLLMAEPAFVQTSTFTHAYAKAGNYKISFTVQNEAGLKTISTVTVHVSGNPTQTSPVISDLSANSSKPRQATILWQTDVRATTLLWYSKTSPVDTSLKPNVSRPAKVKNHKVNLTRLEPNTKYYVVAGSSNSGGVTKSSEVSFTTPALQDDSTPVIKSLTGPKTVVAGEVATVTIDAYDPNNDALTYSADWGDNISAMALMAVKESPFVQTTTFSHIYSSPGTYTAKFTAKDGAGLQTSASLEITVTSDDVDPKIVGNVGVEIGTSTAKISWVTDETSDSEVFYSKITPVDVDADTTVSVSKEELVTEHALELSGLSTNTLYHFIVRSSDASGNATSSSELSFTTSP